MEFKLVRNFNQKKDNEQEKHFEESANLELFFSTEKVIFGIDDWNFKNVKLLLNQKLPLEITLTFQKWNYNLEYLYKQLNLKDSLSLGEISFPLKNCIEKKDTVLFSVLVKKLDEQEKFNLCLYLLSLLKTDYEALDLVNKAANSKLINFNKVLNLLFFKYIFGSKS